ncbi:MAG: hypothetical protein LAN84_12420 [Acidobacteriia bacterium]|nr:hypothetical protein [Terriglobia bacterium]
MKHLIDFHRLAGALILLAIAISPAWAQQDDASAKPAARVSLPLPGGQEDQDTQTQPEALNPDERALTGAQDFTLGIAGIRHSYWVPGFRFENRSRWDDLATGAGRNWVSTGYFLGTLSFLKASRHSQLAVNYGGGGGVNESSDFQGSSFHQLALSQAIKLRRWQLLFLDEFSYLPESSFGFGGVGNLLAPGVGSDLTAGLPSLQTNYVPSQSLYTTQGPRISNAFVTQVGYSLSARSSLAATGSFGILRFTQTNVPGDTNDAIFSLGYNYEVTSWDSLGVLYRFTGYRFLGNPQKLDDHAAQIAYGRRLTGRLALRLTAGPQVTIFRQLSGTNSQRVGVTSAVSLHYTMERTGLSLSYDRGLTGGSGVLIGATRDQIQTQVTTQLTRKWQGSAGVGYARNKSASGSFQSSAAQAFDTTFASAGVGHTLGRMASFTLNYTFAYQNVNQALCTPGSCGTNYKQHQIWAGFQWHARPFVIR